MRVNASGRFGGAPGLFGLGPRYHGDSRAALGNEPVEFLVALDLFEDERIRSIAETGIQCAPIVDCLFELIPFGNLLAKRGGRCRDRTFFGQCLPALLDKALQGIARGIRRRAGLEQLGYERGERSRSRDNSDAPRPAKECPELAGAPRHQRDGLHHLATLRCEYLHRFCAERKHGRNVRQLVRQLLHPGALLPHARRHRIHRRSRAFQLGINRPHVGDELFAIDRAGLEGIYPELLRFVEFLLSRPGRIERRAQPREITRRHRRASAHSSKVIVRRLGAAAYVAAGRPHRRLGAIEILLQARDFGDDLDAETSGLNSASHALLQTPLAPGALRRRL